MSPPSQIGTSILGQQGAVLGGFILAENVYGGPTFGFKAHVMDAFTVRVVFETPVDNSALKTSAYSLFPVFGAPQIFVPNVVSVAFFDNEMLSVVVSLSDPLTLSSVYSIQLNGIISFDGKRSATYTYNFIAAVPNPPLAVKAVLSSRSCLDIIFDRRVRDTSSLDATAKITPILQNVVLPSFDLTLVSEADTPENNIRFRIPDVIFSGDTFLIQYQNVTDSSYNTAESGETFLDVRLPSSPPWSYSDLSIPAVISACVNETIPADNEVHIDVFFSCPMLETDVVDISKWTVTKEGVHLPGVSSPVVAPDPIDSSSFITLCADLKSKFGLHLVTQDVHYENANYAPSVASVIGLLNHLLNKYNSHAVLVPSHTSPDRRFTVDLNPAYTVEQAVILAFTLKSKYNDHLTGIFNGVPYHIINDNENAITSPDPLHLADLQGAATIADELRTRLLMHELGQWHSSLDTINAPIFPYSLPGIVFPSITTVSEAISFLNELQLKYKGHLLSVPVHLYEDDINTIMSQVVIDESIAWVIAADLKQYFNGHILYEFPVNVVSVIPFTDSISAAPIIDGFTYLARLIVNGYSTTPIYSINVTLDSSDHVNQLFEFETKPFGTADVMSVGVRSQSLTIRISAGLELPKFEDISISAVNGPLVKITGISIETTYHSLQNLITEMMNVFREHLNESGLSDSGQNVQVHSLNDINDNFDDSNIPSMNEESLVTAVNFLKSVYNNHVKNAGGLYHVFNASADSVNIPDAYDFRSASSLASVLNFSLINHRNNLSSHFGRGSKLQFAKIFDTIVMYFDGLTDGGDYILTANLKIIPNNPNEINSPVLQSISVPFSGISHFPYLSAACPVPGAGHATTKGGLSRDQLFIFFSKPMHEEPVLPDFFSITGPPELSIGESQWQNSRVLNVQISEMQDNSQYGIDIDSLMDLYGNPIQTP